MENQEKELRQYSLLGGLLILATILGLLATIDSLYDPIFTIPYTLLCFVLTIFYERKCKKLEEQVKDKQPVTQAMCTNVEKILVQKVSNASEETLQMKYEKNEGILDRLISAAIRLISAAIKRLITKGTNEVLSMSKIAIVCFSSLKIIFVIWTLLCVSGFVAGFVYLLDTEIELMGNGITDLVYVGFILLKWLISLVVFFFPLVVLFKIIFFKGQNVSVFTLMGKIFIVVRKPWFLTLAFLLIVCLSIFTYNDKKEELRKQENRRALFDSMRKLERTLGTCPRCNIILDPWSKCRNCGATCSRCILDPSGQRLPWEGKCSYCGRSRLGE